MKPAPELGHVVWFCVVPEGSQRSPRLSAPVFPGVSGLQAAQVLFRGPGQVSGWGGRVEGVAGLCQRTAGGLGGAGWTDPEGRGAIALLPVGEGWRPHWGGGLRRCPPAVGDYANAVRARRVPQNGRAAHRGVVRVPLYPARFRAPRNRSCHEALTPQPGADRVLTGGRKA